jgi:hypothetical protein
VLFHFASFCVFLLHFASFCFVWYHFVSFCFILFLLLDLTLAPMLSSASFMTSLCSTGITTSFAPWNSQMGGHDPPGPPSHTCAPPMEMILSSIGQSWAVGVRKRINDDDNKCGWQSWAVGVRKRINDDDNKCGWHSWAVGVRKRITDDDNKCGWQSWAVGVRKRITDDVNKCGWQSWAVGFTIGDKNENNTIWPCWL